MSGREIVVKLLLECIDGEIMRSGETMVKMDRVMVVLNPPAVGTKVIS